MKGDQETDQRGGGGGGGAQILKEGKHSVGGKNSAKKTHYFHKQPNKTTTPLERGRTSGQCAMSGGDGKNRCGVCGKRGVASFSLRKEGKRIKQPQAVLDSFITAVPWSRSMVKTRRENA